MQTPDAKSTAPSVSPAARVSTPVISVKCQGRVLQMTYQELFTLGYQHWLNHHFEEARKVFIHLVPVTDQGPMSHILLAHCHAMLGDYSECSRTLHDGLPSERYGLASIDLHDAFVMWRCGLLLEVREGLEKVIREHAQLPTPCLILGAFLREMGNTTRPPELLQKAIERDLPGGAIADIARRMLPLALKRARRAHSRAIRPRTTGQSEATRN